MKNSIVNSKVITAGVKTAAGFAAGNLVSSMVPVPQNFKFAIPLVGAGLTAAFLKKKGTEVAVGMAVSGVVQAIQQFAPSVANQAGLGYLPSGSGVPVNQMLTGYRINGVTDPRTVPNDLVVQ